MVRGFPSWSSVPGLSRAGLSLLGGGREPRPKSIAEPEVPWCRRWEPL